MSCLTKQLLRFSWLPVLLLLVACSSSSSGDEPRVRPTLSIYIYAPDHTLLTRAADGVQIEASDGENMINRLQIWVFEHGTEKLIGAMTLANDQLANLNSELRGEVYRMEVPETFAQAGNRPHVDVYVLANVENDNCGDSKNEGAHRSYPVDGSLETTHIAPNFFCPSIGIPAAGLPMAGVVRDVAVEGDNPVLKIPTVSLRRAVSKIRFVFSSLADREQVRIEDIVLDGGVLPNLEYLFLQEGADCRVGGDYRDATVSLMNEKALVRTNANPGLYRFENNLLTFAAGIAEGVSTGALTELPAVYLRESNLRLTGTIYYRVGSDASLRSASFAMSDEGGFVRNHVWIVYGYFTAAALELETVDVTSWVATEETENSLYNW